MKLLMTDRPVSAALPQDAAAVDLSALRIANCVGCFGCWTKTPGRCVIRDDAVRVYPLIARSEQVLYVSRVKYGSYAPVMKTMLERAIPVQQAFLRIHNGETHHVQRAVVPKDAVILAYGADRAGGAQRPQHVLPQPPRPLCGRGGAGGRRGRGGGPVVKLLIVNGSPRAPRSNSRRYAELFQARWKGEARYAALTAKNHAELAAAAADCTDLLLVFPLYADGLPAPLLRFLEFLEGAGPEHRPRISVLINCGFLEPHQNDVAVDMVRLFCLENGYPFGACLKIGGGEAILGTPFAFLVRRSIRALARAVAAGRSAELAVTMPLSPRSFVRASTRYWTQMGAANGCTPEQMASMDIEPQP